jgi:Skp family chaperone for outer membrane proteins
MKVVVWGARLGLVLGACGVGDRDGTAAAAAGPGGGGAPPARIAFVNARAALASMPGYAKAESTYVKEGEAAQSGDAKAADRPRLRRSPTSSSSRRCSPRPTAPTRRKELETKNEQLQTRAREIQQRMGQRERELLQPMQERLSAIIDGIRAESNYTMIIDLGAQGLGIVTYDKSLDITQRVVARLRQTN